MVLTGDELETCEKNEQVDEKEGEYQVSDRQLHLEEVKVHLSFEVHLLRIVEGQDLYQFCRQLHEHHQVQVLDHRV